MAVTQTSRPPRSGAAGDVMLEAARTAPTRPGALARRVLVLAVVIIVLASLYAAGVGRSEVVRASGLPQLVEFFAAAARPRADAEFLGLVLTATVTTLSYAVLGTLLSLVIGLAGGILTSQLWWQSTSGQGLRGGRGALWVGLRTLMAMPRGIHEVVWGLVLLSIFGIQPIVAVLAIGIPFGAVTAKVFSELLDEASRRPYEALIAAGSRRLPALLYGVLPTAVADLFSYGFYRFECAIRSATILGLIGAGGLGFQLQLSFQSLVYTEIWTLLYALILLCAVSDMWSSAVRRRRTVIRRVGGPLRGYDPVLLASLGAVVVLAPTSTWWIGLDLSVLWSPRTWELTQHLLEQTWPLHLDNATLVELLRLSGITLAMSVIAMVIAFTGGMLLAFPAARRRSAAGARSVPRQVARTVVRAVLIVLRAIPPPVWALLLLFVFYPGILPGAVALGVYTLGVLGRLMAEAAENLDERPLRALRAAGAAPSQVFCYGVVPAAAPRFVAYGLYRWEVTIRETVVVGVVGAGGLGLLLSSQLTSFDYSGAATTLIAIMILTAVVDLISASVRRVLR